MTDELKRMAEAIRKLCNSLPINTTRKHGEETMTIDLKPIRKALEYGRSIARWPEAVDLYDRGLAALDTIENQPAEGVSEMKPCPFCGGVAKIYQTKIDNIDCYKAICNNPFCLVKPSTHSLTKNNTSRIWNTRSEKQPTDRDVGALLEEARRTVAPAPANLKKLCDAYHQARVVKDELESLRRRMFNNMREFTAEQALARMDFILDALKPFDVLTGIEGGKPDA